MSNLLLNEFGQPVRVARAIWPPGSKESTWARLEPLISVEQLKLFYLMGIPLVSYMPDPVTGQHQTITDQQLPLFIQRAVSTAEAETGVSIMPTEINERHSFDRFAFESTAYFQINRRPVWAIRKLTIRTSDETDIFSVPSEWLTTAQLWRGRVNILPLTLAFASSVFGGPATGAAGAAFLSSLGSFQFIPCYWCFDALIGFPDGLVPVLINDLIGVIAASEILGMLAATNSRITSASTGIDGLSQSLGISPQIFATRIADLKEKREKIVHKLRNYFGTGGYSMGVL